MTRTGSDIYSVCSSITKSEIVGVPPGRDALESNTIAGHAPLSLFYERANLGRTNVKTGRATGRRYRLSVGDLITLIIRLRACSVHDGAPYLRPVTHRIVQVCDHCSTYTGSRIRSPCAHAPVMFGLIRKSNRLS